MEYGINDWIGLRASKRKHNRAKQSKCEAAFFDLLAN